jgi:hypothetical protein
MNTEENQTQTGTDEAANKANKQKAADGKEIIDELTNLGQKFVEVVEVAWNSEQRKKIEEDLRTGLVSVASSLEDGFKQLSETKEAKEVANAAEDVADKVRSSKIASELSSVLAQGLRTLSEQMDKLAAELKQKSSTTASSTTTSTTKDTQDIPISREDQV